jgi:asparagine synthetase B (glutamine-hydrolysing)
LKSYLTNTFNQEIESTLAQHVFNSRNLSEFHLFVSKELIELSLAIPDCFKAIPSGGQMYEKAVLRYAFLKSLPKEVALRNHRQIMTAMNETYVVRNRKKIEKILGEESVLVRRGIVDQNKLRTCLRDTEKLALSASGLIVTCMTELWLRSFEVGFQPKEEEHVFI